MMKFVVASYGTCTTPDGVIEPLGPAVVVTAYVSMAKLAVTEWAWVIGRTSGLLAEVMVPVQLTKW
jgi:hypothetical protein